MSLAIAREMVVNNINRADNVEEVDNFVHGYLRMLSDFDSNRPGITLPELAERYPEHREVFDAACNREADLLRDVDILIF